MKKRVTIQDIADALGFSRNTVSKAINNSDGIADSTRDLVLQKAAEMGYKQFSYIKIASSVQTSLSSFPEASEGATEIALFTASFLSNSHFASTMLDRLQQDLTALGYTLNTHRVTEDNLGALTLPITFSEERTAAILCVEMFNRRYSEMICRLGLPVLFVDAPAKIDGISLPADQLYMENTAGITRFVNDMLKQGFRKIGFIGNYTHCQSFYERYLAFRCAMLMAGVPTEDRYIIKANDYGEIAERLAGLRSLPDIFICANDFLAIDAMHILRALGRSIPEEVQLCGFDDASESKLIAPQLTTVHIHTQSMAFSAMQLLMTRIKEPSLDYRIAYTETELIYRESTVVPPEGGEK